MTTLFQPFTSWFHRRICETEFYLNGMFVPKEHRQHVKINDAIHSWIPLPLIPTFTCILCGKRDISEVYATLPVWALMTLGSYISYEDDTVYLRSKGPTPLGLFMMLLSRLARSLKPLLQWKSCHDDTCCWNTCQHCVNFVRNRWAAFQSSSVFLSWNNTNSSVIFPLSIFQKCVVLSKKDT